MTRANTVPTASIGARSLPCTACDALARYARLVRLQRVTTAAGCAAFLLFVVTALTQTLLPALRGALSFALVFGGMGGAALLLPLSGLLRAATVHPPVLPRVRARVGAPLGVAYRGAHTGCPAHPVSVA